jgi:hypothetical protein
MHGFGSATAVNDVAQGNGSKPLTLTSGDYDPSGLYMSERDMWERDMPDRLDRHGGKRIKIERIALLAQRLRCPWPEAGLQRG